MTSKPLAFVIMPFDEEFKPIYKRFIKPVLEETGYKVKRADDIESQRNILRDILEEIHSSDLIVADLTTSNPNVFYELGLAHALGKSAILVTQSIEDVPFDLHSYRLLKYSTHFDEIDNAREQLAQKVKASLKGTIPFGTPVTDFLQGMTLEKQSSYLSQSDTVDNQSDTVDDDERGFLDHLIDINEGYTRIAEIVERVGVDLEEMTLSTNTTTDEFTRIGTNPSASSPAAARNASRKLATQIGHFTSKLKKANGEYASIAQETEDSLEFVVSFQRELSDANDPEVDEQLESLRSLQVAVTSGRDSFFTLAYIMDELPRIERRLNREVARAGEEIRVMASNLDRTIASISRALRDQA